VVKSPLRTPVLVAHPPLPLAADLLQDLVVEEYFQDLAAVECLQHLVAVVERRQGSVVVECRLTDRMDSVQPGGFRVEDHRRVPQLWIRRLLNGICGGSVEERLRKKVRMMERESVKREKKKKMAKDRRCRTFAKDGWAEDRSRAPLESSDL
jgi:hypothetical protein